MNFADLHRIVKSVPFTNAAYSYIGEQLRTGTSETSFTQNYLEEGGQDAGEINFEDPRRAVSDSSHIWNVSFVAYVQTTASKVESLLRVTGVFQIFILHPQHDTVILQNAELVWPVLAHPYVQK